MKGTYKILIIILSVFIISIFILNMSVKSETMLTPVKGKVTSRFGEKRTTGTHNGIDIAAPTGTPIISPLSGVVSAIYSNERGGNQLIILHKNGITTGYAHLHKTFVQIGERVKRGQLIAQVGNTGTSTGSHLHFTVTKFGIKQNPEDYIKT